MTECVRAGLIEQTDKCSSEGSRPSARARAAGAGAETTARGGSPLDSAVWLPPFMSAAREVPPRSWLDIGSRRN